MQAYSDKTQETNPYALPDLEIFHAIDYSDGDLELEDGWYWWTCMPGCLPDSEPSGPHDTPEEALAEARDSCFYAQ